MEQELPESEFSVAMTPEASSTVEGETLIPTPIDKHSRLLPEGQKSDFKKILFFGCCSCLVLYLFTTFALWAFFSKVKTSSGDFFPVTTPSERALNETPSTLFKQPPGTSTLGKRLEDNLQPVTSHDHIIGSLNAKITVVVFSDIQCPYCKSFHPVIRQLTDQYKDGTDVAVVFRHFPIDALHPNARKAAIATECVSSLGSENKFWDYLGELMVSQDLSGEFLTSAAVKFGIDKGKFSSCLTASAPAKLVEANVQDGTTSGVRGTPSSIIIWPNGSKTLMAGGQPFSTFKNMLEEQLK
ncbi:MAG: DsbA family protein [bacterium]